MPEVLQLDEMMSYGAPCVLAIGIFDGLHKGHRRVLECALNMAKSENAKAGVLTFDPHPSRVIPMGRSAVEIIYPSDLRASRFIEAKVDAVFFKKFDKKFASLSPDEFAGYLSEKFPNLRGIVTGSNFLFGKNAAGNAAVLEKICACRGWKYKAVDGMMSGGERISSTRLRECLLKGDMGEYAKLAGENYAAEGIVRSGRHLGRKLGFATLNLPWEPQCKPPYGVYAVRLERKGAVYNGVANYGLAPSVGDSSKPILEVHLFDAPNFGARSKIKVEFFKFIRAEKKFPDLDSLKAQIAIDCKKAEEFFRRRD